MKNIPKIAVITLILFLSALALIWPYVFGQWEAEKDYRKIQEDMDIDSLKEEFHFQNGLFRGLVIGLTSAAVFAVLIYQYRIGILFPLTYFFYASALFGYSFTSNLNTLRGLHKWYVSHAPRASYTDKFFRLVADKWNALLGKLHRKTGWNWWPLNQTPAEVSRLFHSAAVAVGFLLLAAVIVGNFT